MVKEQFLNTVMKFIKPKHLKGIGFKRKNVKSVNIFIVNLNIPDLGRHADVSRQLVDLQGALNIPDLHR